MAVVVAAFVVVVGFEAFEHDVYVVFFSEDVGEVFNQFQYVAGDVGRAFGVDGYFRTRADVFQGFLDGSFVQERDFFCQFQADFVGFSEFFAAEVVGAFHVALKDEDDADGEPDADAFEQVERDDGDEGGGEWDELVQPFMPEMQEGGGFCQFVAHQQQDGGEGGQGDHIEDKGNRQNAHQQQNAVNNGRQFVRRACIGIGGRAHDDGGDGQAADKRTDDVACALRAQFAVGVGDAAAGVEATMAMVMPVVQT